MDKIHLTRIVINERFINKLIKYKEKVVVVLDGNIIINKND